MKIKMYARYEMVELEVQSENSWFTLELHPDDAEKLSSELMEASTSARKKRSPPN